VKNVWKTNNIFHCKLCWKNWIFQPVSLINFTNSFFLITPRDTWCASLRARNLICVDVPSTSDPPLVQWQEVSLLTHHTAGIGHIGEGNYLNLQQQLIMIDQVRCGSGNQDIFPSIRWLFAADVLNALTKWCGIAFTPENEYFHGVMCNESV
jgi:hypothetical protein